MTVIKKILILALPVLIGGVILLNCTNQKEIDRNTKEILSLLFNESVRRERMPLNIPRGDSIIVSMAYKENDTIIVGVSTEMIHYGGSINLARIDSSYHKLRNQLLIEDSKAKTFNLKDLSLNEKAKLIKWNDSLTELARIKCDYIKFGIDMAIIFTNVVLNEQMDLAMVGMSNSTSCLAGGFGMYFLEKVNGKWKVVKYHETEIS